MTGWMPAFVVLPLISAFVLPILGGRRFKPVATVFANLVTLALLLLALAWLPRLLAEKVATYRVGNWDPRVGILMVLDGLSWLMLAVIAIVSAAAMLFGARYMEQYTAKAKYLSLFMLMLAGMNGVVLAGDLFNLFVFLEIASIASYALVGFGCKDEQLEASFKYMVIGGVGSSLILLGIALVYGNAAALNMAFVSKAISSYGWNNGLTFALVLFVVGFGIKAAVVPFHAWLPDAHPAAPAPISAMLSGLLIKTLGVYGLTRVIFNVFGLTGSIGWVLIGLGLASMVTGALLGIGQWDVKRLLAYSSISQVGYIFAGLGLGAVLLQLGNAHRDLARWAVLGALLHLANHAVYKALLFLTSGSIEMATGTRQMDRLGGLAQRMPLTRAACLIGSASIAGIFPFAGFWSKLVLVVAAVQARFFWLAAAMVAVAVCTLIMYLRLHRYVFLGPLPESAGMVRDCQGSMRVAMLILTVVTLAMGLVLIVPQVRGSVLDPAVDVVVGGVKQYLAMLEG